MIASIGEIISNFINSPIVAAAMLGTAGAFVALWLAGTWWAYLDASRRTESELGRFGAVALIILSTPLLLPFSLLVYSLARPQTTTSQRRVLQLIGGLTPAVAGRLGCEECGSAVDPDWRRCPACAAWVTSPCGACGEWSEQSAEICPWCAAGKSEVPRALPEPAWAAPRPARRSPAPAATTRRAERTPVPHRLRLRGATARHEGPVEAGS